MMTYVKIFTDGCCLGNSGRGGWAAILTGGQRKKEIYGGFKLTTNNRMELQACIKGLEALNIRCKVTIVSVYKYCVDAINNGWAVKWRANNWMRNRRDKAKNIDLWKRLLVLVEYHEVTFSWVKGHSALAVREGTCDQSNTSKWS